MFCSVALSFNHLGNVIIVTQGEYNMYARGVKYIAISVFYNIIIRIVLFAACRSCFHFGNSYNFLHTS